MGNPIPNVIPPSLWPRIFGCTANYASMYHSNLPLEFAPSINGKVSVPCKYSTRCQSFFQLSKLGSLTLEVRNEIDVEVSGLACFVTNRVLATILWNVVAISFGNFIESSSTMNRLSGAHDVTFLLDVIILNLLLEIVVINLSQLDIISIIYLIILILTLCFTV